MLKHFASALSSLHKHSQQEQRDASELWTIVVVVAAAIVWSAIAGKDLNWDQLNYHFYVAHSFLNDRLGHDFIAANGQSYLNPLAYIPFYWMVAHGWHSVLIGSVLAAFHSLNIVLAYYIAKAVLTEQSDGTRRRIAKFGATLAFLSPMFLMTVGPSFADVTTAVFALASVLLILHVDIGRQWRSNRILLAGLCFGAACGLKQSNLVFSPAFALMLLILHPTLRGTARAWGLFAVGGSVGLVATHGYWSWQLWTTFYDTSLPLLSVVLGYPDVPRADVGFPQRFLPESVLEGVLLPFRIVQLRSWIYVESVAPDLRIAAAVLAVLVAAGVWLRKRVAKPVAATQSASKKLLALVGFFVAALALWIGTSANGRYGIVVSVLCGTTLAVLAQNLLRRRSVVISSLALLVGLQLFHLQHGQFRWTSEKWTRSWYEVSIPERLKKEPYLYISVGGNSNSYIAPYLAADSAFTNPIGQISFDLDGLGGKRLGALLDQYEGRVRILSRASPSQDEQDIDLWLRSADSLIARFGFAVEPNDCLMIRTAGPQWQLGDSFAKRLASFNHLRTCALRSRPYKEAAERARIHKIVQSINSWCPRLFGMRHTVVEQTPEGWYVSYASTDSTLQIKPDGIFLTQPRTSRDLYLGTLHSWERGERPECSSIPTRLRDVYTFD